jgi:hypothetical protein
MKSVDLVRHPFLHALVEISSDQNGILHGFHVVVTNASPGDEAADTASGVDLCCDCRFLQQRGALRVAKLDEWTRQYGASHVVFVEFLPTSDDD